MSHKPLIFRYLQDLPLLQRFTLKSRKRDALSRLAAQLRQVGAVILSRRPPPGIARSVVKDPCIRPWFELGIPSQPLPLVAAEDPSGQVPEWLNGLAWKACVLVTVPGVRIPPCP